MALNVLAHEPAIRMSAFIGVFALMAIWELVAPRRTLTVTKSVRWTNNLALVALNTIALRFIFPVAATGLALHATDQGWGVLQQVILPEILRVLIGIVVLDLAIYFQHVLFHAVPALWRLHRVHHADLDFDVTTGARFHPIEIFLSMAIKFSVILAVGPPALAVLIFEVVLNATAMFNHANVHIPSTLERVVRWFIVTPDMHRVHHSVLPNETNRNFGFSLSVWDRIFGTYRAQPAKGHTEMTIGLTNFRDPHEVDRLAGMLWLPFVGSVDEYAINRRSPTSMPKAPS
ncbi:MAG: sterol desaturase family protein [Gammaproteobacteria bacterium]